MDSNIVVFSLPFVQRNEMQAIMGVDHVGSPDCLAPQLDEQVSNLSVN